MRDWADCEQVRHRHVLPRREARFAEHPPWVPASLRARLLDDGIDRLWRHQRVAADALHSGRHTIVATGTASGKTLSYLMEVIAATLNPPLRGGESLSSTQLLALAAGRGRRSALYLAPTKALAHDQLRVCETLGLPGWRVGPLDGDSEEAERTFARDHAHYVLSNPDMVHASVLPQHRRWAPLLRSLRVIVVDECHRYRGVFGAHVASVLRRLLRVCASYGAHPVVAFASATTANPGALASSLIGVDEADVAVVTEDASPHGCIDMLLWQPTQPADTEAASVMAELVDGGKRVITFVPSRLRTELVAARARERLTSPRRIESYRSGYLATDRRRLERELQSGDLSGVAATNALELGVDIAGLDAVVINGFPGTLSALWQQAGRAGRGERDSLVVVMAREDPLDAYLFEHPELIFDAPIEATVLHPENPYVLAPHLAAAAQELPLTESDTRWFGPTLPALADGLAAQGVLRRREGDGVRAPRGWFWPHPQRAVDSIDLRSAAGHAVRIVDQGTGRVVGTVDRTAADRTVHAGAVYLHQGESWVVEEFAPDDDSALVRPHRPGYYTQPDSEHDLAVIEVLARRDFFGTTLHFGEVEVSARVTGFRRRDEHTHEVWDSTPLAMPKRVLRTRSVWWTLPAEIEAQLGWNALRLGSAAHAAEHTAIGLLPMFAPCDRWDIGGLSTALHPDTALASVFVHDGFPGGAGFAERGYEVAEAWWIATLTRLLSCGCESGCPSCVISPKCGNANTSLDKQSAITLLMAIGVR